MFLDRGKVYKAIGSYAWCDGGVVKDLAILHSTTAEA